MEHAFTKRVLFGLIVVGTIGFVALAVWYPSFGPFLLLGWLAILYRCVQQIRMLQLEAALLEQRRPPTVRDYGRTIFVQPVDDDGNDLPPTIAQERVAQAQLQAGPRDTVVGVRRKVSETRTD